MRPTDRALLQRQGEAFHEALSDFVRAYLVGERDRICCHDISLSQCYALEALIRRGPSTLKALAADLSLDKSTASRVVSTLQRKGYVGRTAHPVDARSVLLDVTSAGRRLHDRIRADRIAERTQLLAAFPAEVRDDIADAVRRVADATRRRMGCATQPTARLA
ncbi:MAG TPA: MarR family transcriptional regulator [Verrucomicrobiae bacterium]|jgi:MarR family 2-MHQ and catechol resistance regulon transcriptional repressor|nr:MarR family transcriptional regulator [Verrucomicrobiae bacterium]